MANVRLMDAGTTLTEIPPSPTIQKTQSGNSISHSYDVNYADAETALTNAGITFGVAHPSKSKRYLIISWNLLRAVRRKRYGAGSDSLALSVDVWN